MNAMTREALVKLLAGNDPGEPERRKRFYAVAEAADLLGLSEPTLYRAIRAGEFPAIRVRNRYVVPAKAIDDLESSALASGLVNAADYVGKAA
jgi:excisionase family DNA binding protein